MELVLSVYNIEKYLPTNEKYSLVDQMKRASVSIPSNIAEGFGRNSQKEFFRFLKISTSSLFELQTQIEISHRLKFIPDKIFIEVFNESRELERIITTFTRNMMK